MKVVSNLDPATPFDVPRQLGEALIASKILTAYEPPVKVKKPDAVFSVGVFQYNSEPYILAKCTGCGGAVHITGPTAHKTQIFRHCGVTDTIPEQIAAQYARLRKKWDAKPTSAVEQRPAFELTHF